MAKKGYIMAFPCQEPLDEDRLWMKNFGCETIYEEDADNEKRRPQWKQFMTSLECGDEVVLSKFSNALRGSRELVAFLALCSMKMVRIVSIHDKVDTGSELFPETSPNDVLHSLAQLPQETMELRSHTKPARVLKGRNMVFVPKRRYSRETKEHKEKTVINMYMSGYDIDDIRIASGYQSRSSIFRVLNEHRIPLNRGSHSGPIRRKGQQGENPENKD
jgi:DNA invertase Pin-like site-specific DNA recombinase